MVISHCNTATAPNLSNQSGSWWTNQAKGVGLIWFSKWWLSAAKEMLEFSKNCNLQMSQFASHRCAVCLSVLGYFYHYFMACKLKYSLTMSLFIFQVFKSLDFQNHIPTAVLYNKSFGELISSKVPNKIFSWIIVGDMTSTNELISTNKEWIMLHENDSIYLTGCTTQGRHWPAYSHLCRRSVGRTASGSTKRSQSRGTCERSHSAANPEELQAQPETQPPTAAYPYETIYSRYIDL